MWFKGMEVIKVPLYKSVQARKNKAKRIHKKWLKIYGKRLIQTRPVSKNYFIAFNKIMVPEELWDQFIKATQIEMR